MTAGQPRLSIVIPNWNGERYLGRCVAATLRSARKCGHTFELMVIDDASRDGSPDQVEREFPQARLIRNERNLGFGATVMRGAEMAQGELLLLLNNDLVAKESMIGELVEPLLAEPGVFGVTGKTLDWDGVSPNHVNMRAVWKQGGFELEYSDPPDTAPTMFLLGGCCAVRLEEFRRLGGLCPLYAPGYWEDYDLSYLALKAGWSNLYNPRAQAFHFGQGSMKQAFGEHRLHAIRQRNAFLFTWLNLTDSSLLREHALSLPRIAAAGLASRSAEARARTRGAARAFRLIDAVARERARRKPLIRKSDAEIQNDFRSA